MHRERDHRARTNVWTSCHDADADDDGFIGSNLCTRISLLRRSSFNFFHFAWKEEKKIVSGMTSSLIYILASLFMIMMAKLMSILRRTTSTYNNIEKLCVLWDDVVIHGTWTFNVDRSIAMPHIITQFHQRTVTSCRAVIAAAAAADVVVVYMYFFMCISANRLNARRMWTVNTLTFIYFTSQGSNQYEWQRIISYQKHIFFALSCPLHRSHTLFYSNKLI